METDKSGSRRRRRAGECRLVRAELQLLLADLAEVEGEGEVEGEVEGPLEQVGAYDGAGAAATLGLTIARLARRAISAGYLSEVELGRMVLDAGRF